MRERENLNNERREEAVPEKRERGRETKWWTYKEMEREMALRHSRCLIIKMTFLSTSV